MTYSKFISCPINVPYKKEEKNCPGPGSSSGSHVTLCCHFSLASFNLEIFCGISQFFMILRQLSHISYRLSLNCICLVFPPDQIQVVQFGQEYHRGDDVSSSVHHVWKHTMCVLSCVTLYPTTRLRGCAKVSLPSYYSFCEEYLSSEEVL